MKYRFNSKVEFYINNTCNLTCNNCNRFNNHRFTGVQNWSDYQQDYQHWGEYIELPTVVIMGGEPLLNPTICEWVQGIHNIFGCDIQLLTNGLHLAKVRGLYDILLSNQGHVGISLHNLNHFAEIKENIKNFLDHVIIDEYGPAVGEDRQNGIHYSARDVNDMVVNVYLSNSFSTAAVITKPMDGTYTLHQNDPVQAHSVCNFVRHKSYHFVRGRLYKCGPVALFPEFDQQFNLDISDHDRQLVNSYKSMSPELWPQQGLDFMNNIDQVIDQCRFCPIAGPSYPIHPLVKSRKLKEPVRINSLALLK
jgi:organic radical activating enzyme